MLPLILGAALTVIAVPDPGTSPIGASVHVYAPEPAPGGGERRGTIGPGNQARFEVPLTSRAVEITKPGFVPAHGLAVFHAGRSTLRLAFHAAPPTALRTIGAVAAAERGAFNRGPDPVAILPREGYRDQGQPGSATVLTQTPSIAIDRAGRGLGLFFDNPPVPLVRGGTPLETQILLDGNPVELPTTRTLALSAIPAFVLSEVEVHPGQGATLPAIDGAQNGSINFRFAEPTPVWRALPELGGDSRNGSFADISAGGATADRRLGVALAASSNGAKGLRDFTDAIQRALLLKARAALSPSATFTATTYDEIDSDQIVTNRFSYSAADLRFTGARDVVSARWWHAGASSEGAVAGDPFEFRTDDALTGTALELDHTRGADLFSLGVSQTYGQGTADGAVVVAPGSFQRVQTAFVRAVVHPARNLESQFALYDVRANTQANGVRDDEGGIAGRFGLVYRVANGTALRASIGAGFTPPSLIALAGLTNKLGPSGSGTVDLGIERRMIDNETTLSVDVFATHAVTRLLETGPGEWTNTGTVTRRGAEFSLARRPRSGLGFVLQAWTAGETPALAATGSFGDVASGATHGYAEISFHGIQGSRVSLGATYWGADVPLGQPATVLLNTNVEIQIGARAKVQFSIENLNDAARAVKTPAQPFLGLPSASAPGPRTVRLLIRRSFGRTGSDG